MGTSAVRAAGRQKAGVRRAGSAHVTSNLLILLVPVLLGLPWQSAAGQRLEEARTLRRPYVAQSPTEVLHGTGVDTSRSGSKVLKRAGVGALVGAGFWAAYYASYSCDLDCRQTNGRGHLWMLLPLSVGIGALFGAILGLE